MSFKDDRPVGLESWDQSTIVHSPVNVDQVFDSPVEIHWLIFKQVFMLLFTAEGDFFRTLSCP